MLIMNNSSAKTFSKNCGHSRNTYKQDPSFLYSLGDCIAKQCLSALVLVLEI